MQNEETPITARTANKEFHLDKVNGIPTYKDKPVDVTTSQTVSELVLDLLTHPNITALLHSKYGAKMAMTGSLAKNAVVRDRTIQDFDFEMLDEITDNPVSNEILARAKSDVDLFEQLLTFLDGADDPNTPLGALLIEKGVTWKFKTIDILGNQNHSDAIIGFTVDKFSYRRNFGRPWKTDTENSTVDPFAHLRPKMKDVLVKL